MLEIRSDSRVSRLRGSVLGLSRSFFQIFARLVETGERFIDGA